MKKIIENHRKIKFFTPYHFHLSCIIFNLPFRIQEREKKEKSNFSLFLDSHIVSIQRTKNRKKKKKVGKNKRIRRNEIAESAHVDTNIFCILIAGTGGYVRQLSAWKRAINMRGTLARRRGPRSNRNSILIRSPLPRFTCAETRRKKRRDPGRQDLWKIGIAIILANRRRGWLAAVDCETTMDTAVWLNIYFFEKRRD